jgi:hypothetical protein
MQIIIQRIPYSSSEFEYNTGNSSSNGIVYSLIQHLSEIFGEIVGLTIVVTCYLFLFKHQQQQCLQHIYTIYVENNGYQTKYWIGYYEIIIQTAIQKYLLYVILMHIQVSEFRSGRSSYGRKSSSNLYS